jgi:hypothetical protein
MDGWSNESFAYSYTESQNTNRKNPIRVPEDLLKKGPMYQVVAVVVKTKTFEVTGKEKIPFENSSGCVVGSGFILEDDPSKCYTAAHHLGGFIETTPKGYIIAEPESAVVIHFASLRKFDSAVLRTLNDMAMSNFSVGLTQGLRDGVSQASPWPAIAKVCGFRTLAAEPLQQAREISEEIFEFEFKNRFGEQFKLPQSGLDVAVLDLGKGFLSPGLPLVGTRIVAPCLVDRRIPQPEGKPNFEILRGPVPKLDINDEFVSERPVAFGMGLGRLGPGDSRHIDMLVSNILAKEPEKREVEFLDLEPDFTNRTFRKMLKDKESLKDRKQMVNDKYVLEIENSVKIYEGSRAYMRFRGTMHDMQAGGPVLLSPSREYVDRTSNVASLVMAEKTGNDPLSHQSLCPHRRSVLYRYIDTLSYSCQI